MQRYRISSWAVGLGLLLLVGVAVRRSEAPPQNSPSDEKIRSAENKIGSPVGTKMQSALDASAAGVIRSLAELARSQPQQAVDAVRELCAGDAMAEADLGAALVFALIQHGHGEVAASFAADVSDSNRQALVTMAFRGWALREPEPALDAALALDDPARRSVAFHAAASGWARVAPQQLAECALAFPDGPERTFAMTAAVRAWRIEDERATGRWLEQNERKLGRIAQNPILWED